MSLGMEVREDVGWDPSWGREGALGKIEARQGTNTGTGWWTNVRASLGDGSLPRDYSVILRQPLPEVRGRSVQTHCFEETLLKPGPWHQRVAIEGTGRAGSSARQ